MGQKIKLSDVTFTDLTLPKLYDDPIMSDGSLYLLDVSNPLGYDNGNVVPVNGTMIPNIAWAQAKAILGSGDRTTLSPTVGVTFASTAEGKLEFTAKKGLHTMISQVSDGGHEMQISLPDALKTWLRATHPSDHSYFWSIWGRQTRAQAGGGVDADLSICNLTVGTSNYAGYGNVGGFTQPGSGGTFIGKRGSGVVNGSPAMANLGVTGWTGSIPGSNGNFGCFFKVGSFAPFTLLTNSYRSVVLYKLYLEDLTVSGRSYATVDALDLALYTAAFASGGRFNSDTYSDPATVVP